MTTFTFADVFRKLNDLKNTGIIRDYAVGGATAVMFYAEPTRTYDVDVFVLFAGTPESPLIPLSDIYRWAEDGGFETKSEHIMIHGVPVQFLPAHNSLAEEAVDSALTHDYESVPVRVIAPEHLVALAFQAGGSRQRERGWLLIESGKIDRTKLRELLARHQIDEDIDNEK